MAEIDWVFINGNQLLEQWQAGLNPVIGETGFGAGLNFFRVWQLWREFRAGQPEKLNKVSDKLKYFSLEIAPLTSDQLLQVYTNRPELLPLVELFLEQLPPPWVGCHTLEFADVELRLLYGDGCHSLSKYSFTVDAWLLDGFAPSKNQDFWTQELFQAIADHSNPQATLASFTAAGFVRRGLTAAGFNIRKTPGYNKREMICGKLGKPLAAVKPPTSAPTSAKSIAIIGAGYAGLILAHKLASKGQKVHLFDQALQPMMGASANHAHVVYLKPAYVTNAFNQFFEQAYSYACNFYSQLTQAGFKGFHQTGVMHTHFSKAQSRQLLQTWPSNWLQLKDEQTLGIVLPQAGIIQPKLLADYIVSTHDLIEFHGQHQLQTIKRTDQISPQWNLKFTRQSAQAESLSTGSLSTDFRQFDYNFDTLVFATGAQSIDLFAQFGNRLLGADTNKTSHYRYPLRPIAGQSSVLSASAHLPLQAIQQVMCGSAYITPCIDGYQSIGSSFYPDTFDQGVSDQDHESNITKLATSFNLSADATAEYRQAIVKGYAATRLQTTDYLPLVGNIFPEMGSNMFSLTALAAKGSMLSPLLAEVLAHQILEITAAPVSAEHLRMLNPDRFAQRFYKKYASTR